MESATAILSPESKVQSAATEGVSISSTSNEAGKMDKGRPLAPMCEGGCGTSVEASRFKMPMKDDGTIGRENSGEGSQRWRCGKCHAKSMRSHIAPKEPRSVHSLEELDAALTETEGNRKTAAELLGLTASQMKSRIHDNPVLRQKWSREQMNGRAVESERSEKGLLPAKPEQVKGALMEAQYQLLERRNKLLIRIEAIEKRIDLGEQAKESDDPEFQRKHAFAKNSRGDLSEEVMLRENLTKLISLDLEIQAEARETFWTFAKIEHLDADNRRSKINPAKKAKIGWVPKGEAIPV